MPTASHSWPLLAGAFAALLAPAQGVSADLGATADFEGYAVASNEELASLRGGFELSINGQLLSLAFSLERVSMLNGELLAFTRIVVPDLVQAIAMPQTVSVSTYVAEPSAGTVAAAAPAGVVGVPAVPSPQVVQIVVPAGAANVTGPDAATLVTLIQNGAGNSVALPAAAGQQVEQALQAAQVQVMQAQNQATIIQNTLDNQVIQNLTTLNVTLTNAALARAAELNAALQGMLNQPIVLPR